MKKVSNEELKRIQLEILDAVADFCDKNGIKYWLNFGTLIGAVRHKGYIPWDDDIDIGMLRDEYVKFCELFNKSNKKYRFFFVEEDKNYFLPYGKVADLDTLLYEPDEKGEKFYINIDIFPFDNAPSSLEECSNIFERRDLIRRTYLLRYNREGFKGDGITKFIKTFVSGLFNLIPNYCFARLISGNAKKFSQSETDYIANFVGYSRYILKKDWVRDTSTLEFEGKNYKVPIDYDSYLNAIYGDYLTLPPENQRKSTHSFIAYIKKIS